MTSRIRITYIDRDEITVTVDGKEVRSWSYADRGAQRIKMLMAREFVEGWYQGVADDKGGA